MCEIETYRCADCDWAGWSDELVDDDDSGKFDQCPQCGGRELYVELEEDGGE